jgi:hypothetical protein
LRVAFHVVAADMVADREKAPLLSPGVATDLQIIAGPPII